MSDWSDGYITSVEYTSHFYAAMSPVAQNLGLLLDGFMPIDLTQPFSFCELGCGQGFTTALLAAANPGGRFWGVDFNPSHIAGANQLAAAAGLGNLTYLEKSFGELSAAGLPEFDFIALHGVWSWISRANRDAITAFIKTNLKPGGIVYISYNAQPGWAAIAPLRQLFIESQRHKSEADLSSVDEAVGLAHRMRDANARFFAMNPIAGSNLDSLGKLSKNYLLHEYFNRAWEPSYFSEVAGDLKSAKLSFACSSDVVEHLDKLCLSAEAQEQLKGVPDLIARQTIRDYFCNSRFRRDLFARGARRLTTEERVAMLDDLLLAPAVGMPKFPFQAAFPIGAVTMQAEPFGRIAAKLKEGAKTFGALCQDPEFKHLDAQGLFQPVLLLLAAGFVQAALPAGGQDERRLSTQRFNQAVLARPIGLEAQMLASPVTGSGVPVSRLEQFLIAQTQGGQTYSAESLSRLIRQQNLKVTQSANSDGSAAEADDAMEKALEEFETRRRPIYRALGLF